MPRLNEEQRDFVFNYQNGVIINASPGTGKTNTLVHRALHKIESLPKFKKIALITYTNAGTDEIITRLVNKEDTFIGTIHSFCLQYILRPYAWLYEWGKLRVINYEEQLIFIEQNQDFDFGDTPVDELNKIKRNLDGTFDTDIQIGNETDSAPIINRYLEYLDDIGVIDFNELLYRSYKIIHEHEFVLKSLANKFYEILIDEFQDTNLIQYEIFKSINSQEVTTFFLVGDEKQKILRFAGAIDNAFLNAQNDFNLPLQYLIRAYRSTNNIVAAYSSVFEGHPHIINESNINNLDIRLIRREFNYRDNNLESNLNVSIDYLVNTCGVALDQIAILSKTWFDALNASRFLRQQYNVVGLGALPHSMTNIRSTTFDLIKNLAKFKLVKSIKNLKSLKRSFEAHLLENNIYFAEEEKIYKQNALIQSFGEITENTNLIESLYTLKNRLNGLFGIEHLIIQNIIDNIDPNEIIYWDFGKYVHAISHSGGILSTTMHQSKGLEFEAVVLNQMNVGKIPHQTWNPVNRSHGVLTTESLEDGKKLFYVGLSRAKKYLIILHNWNPSILVQSLNENGHI